MEHLYQFRVAAPVSLPSYASLGRAPPAFVASYFVKIPRRLDFLAVAPLCEPAIRSYVALRLKLVTRFLLHPVRNPFPCRQHFICA